VPPLPVITGVYRVTLNWGTPSPSVHAHNVMHFFAPTLTDATLFTAIDGAVTAAMWDTVVNTASVKSVDTMKLDGSSPTVNHATGSPLKWQGQSTGSDYIPQGCCVVSEYTATRGRSHRGRVYLPWVSEGEQTSGNLLDIPAMQTAWTAFLANVAAADAFLHVASYKLGTSSEVTSVVVKDKLKTQRRRSA
jgi:hypothetical protein